MATIDELREQVRFADFTAEQRMHIVEILPAVENDADYAASEIVKLEAERDAALYKLDRWEQVWTALNDMGAQLGDANKPLAVTASWALMQRENAELQSQLHEADAAGFETSAELERANLRLTASEESLAGCAQRVAQLSSKLERCKNLLGELFAMVEGECPSLLSEDSGGDAELGLQIEEALSDG